MARLELLFLQSEIARHTNLKRVWFLSYHHMPESIFRKSLGCRWDQTRAACVTSGRFIHYAIASRASRFFIDSSSLAVTDHQLLGERNYHVYTTS